MSTLRRRLVGAWPHLRALFVGYHLLAVVVLSLPTAGAMTSDSMWRSANFKADIAGYAGALGSLGVEMTPEELTQRLRGAAFSFAGIRTAIAWPFDRYARLVGARQGWAMFASPQRHPAELNVEIKVDGAWRTIYRPHDESADWRGETMRHNRVRKYAGRFARGFIPKNYDELASWLATEASVDHPEATAVRVRLYRYRSLPPEKVRAGERPAGHYERVRTFDAAELRP